MQITFSSMTYLLLCELELSHQLLNVRLSINTLEIIGDHLLMENFSKINTTDATNV